MSYKRVHHLFQLDNNIDIDFISRELINGDWENKFIRSIWDLRLCMLSEKQHSMMQNILKMCIKIDPNKPFHSVKVGPNRYVTMSKEDKEAHEATDKKIRESLK
jgi:hypothetical protein